MTRAALPPSYGVAPGLLTVGRLRMMAADEMRAFTPSPSFAGFLASEAHRIAIRAANRVGKTRHMAFRAAQSMLRTPGFRARAVGPTRMQTHAVTGKYLAEFLGPNLSPRSYYTDGRGWNQATILTRNGSLCQLKSYEDSPNAHAGDDLDLVLLDEPPPMAHFAENLTRVISRNGMIVLGFTAINRPVGWLRRILDDPANAWEQHVIPFRREHVPWYTAEQFESMIAAFRSSPWQWAQRVEAEWEGITEGRVFDGFGEASVTSKTPRGDVSIGIGMDHGVVAGHQAVVLVAWRGQQIWALDEYVSTWGTTPEQDAALTLDMLRRNAIKPEEVLRAVGDTNWAGGSRVNDLIESAMQARLHLQHPPFRIRNADKSPGSVDFGMRVVNHAAHRQDLQVHERCTGLIDSLRNWKGARTPTSTDGRLAHIADALRYVAVDVLGRTHEYERLRFV